MRNIADILKDDREGKELSKTERQIAVAYIQGKYDAVRELKLVAWDKVSKEISFEMKFADGDYYKGLKFANDMLNIIFDKKIKEGSEE